MFYEQFYQLCKKAGVTPANVADAIGINKSTVYMWKQQKTAPRYDTAKKIAKYFGITVDELLTEQEHAAAIIKHIKEGLSEACTQKKQPLFVASKQLTEAQLDKRLMESYRTLTYEGKLRATERVEEIAQIPRFQVSKSSSDEDQSE